MARWAGAGEVWSTVKGNEIQISARDCPPHWQVIDLVLRLNDQSGRLWLIQAPEVKLSIAI